MSIAAQDIKDLMFAQLDANSGSDYYRDDLDIIPAINYAQDWLVSVVNSAYNEKKISGKVFEELSFTRVFQTNNFSRLSFDTGAAALDHNIWKIVSVFPEITTIPSNATITSVNDEVSIYRNNVSLDLIVKSADYVTAEEWPVMLGNPFVAGNTINENCADLVDYAYRTYTNYNSTGYAPTIVVGTEISPRRNKQFVAVEYIAEPTNLVAITGNLDFPIIVKNLITEKALDFIAAKQGDSGPLKENIAADIGLLTQLSL